MKPIATTVAPGGGRWRETGEGVLMECIKQVISVTAQVAISTRVQRYRLALRRRQEEKTAADNGEGTLHSGA